MYVVGFGPAQEGMGAGIPPLPQAKLPDRCSFSQRQNHNSVQTTSSKSAPPEKPRPLQYLGHQLHRLRSLLLQALKKNQTPFRPTSGQAEPVVSAD